MRRVLSRGIHTIELLRQGQEAPGIAGRVLLPSRSSARIFLRAFTRDPSNRKILRRALAGEIGGQRAIRLSDREVVELIASQIARGRLHVVSLSASRAVLKQPPDRDWTAPVQAVEEPEPVVLASTEGPPPEPEPEAELEMELGLAVEAPLFLEMAGEIEGPLLVEIGGEAEEPFSLEVATDIEEA